MRFAALEGRRVAVWGYGREGRAALTTLRARLPGQPLTLFCREGEAENLGTDAALTIRHEAPDAQALSAFDVVVKSPGISAYKPEIEAARAQGAVFTSGTALWFAERPDARVIGVTGTKGKSTTSALVAHLARSLGVRTVLAGNIGVPLLEVLDLDADLWVIELSSFQTAEAGPLEVGVITNLYQEHLDWHGTAERYAADKLRLADAARTLLVPANQPDLLARTAGHAHRILFGDASGWHADADGGIARGCERVLEAGVLAAHGLHNLANACAALAALEAAGLDAVRAAPALRDFRPLPHRLQSLGERDGVEWINDSISTAPEAILAAIESLPGRAVTVIAGGHDRGLDWAPFVEAMKVHPPHAIVLQGASGPRIAAALQQAGVACEMALMEDLEAAVHVARARTPRGGAVLLSPGAPSFDQFRDYTQRGRRFAELAGFDPEAIAGIQGLGVA